MENVSLIFGSSLRLKLMRLFLFNADMVFDEHALISKFGIKEKVMRPELLVLVKAGLLKTSSVIISKEVKKGKKIVVKKSKSRAYRLNPKFIFIDALSDFLIRTHSFERKKVLKRIEKTGRIKAVLVAGVFTRNPESRIDLFVVGDNVNTASLDRVVKSMESEIGRDIRYAMLSAPDFAYRKGMNDRLVRDVLDFPHEVLVDKLGISLV